VRVPDLAGVKGSGAAEESTELLTRRDGPRSSLRSHVAVVANPVVRGDRALVLVLICPGKGRGRAREVEFEEINAVPEADQVIWSGVAEPGAFDQRLTTNTYSRLSSPTGVRSKSP
jgi:hypothetical protein